MDELRETPEGPTELPEQAVPLEMDTQALISSLQASGAQVSRVETIQETFFPISGEVLNIDGASVQVFEFPNETERQAVSRWIAEDGSSIGTVMIDWASPPRIWATGRLIVIYVENDQTVFEKLTEILGDPITKEVEVPANVTSNPAVAAAMDRLSQFKNIPLDQIELVSAEHVQWPDECMGISRRGQMCAQVITPGWRIVLQAGDQQYTFHTDEIGVRVGQRQ